MPSSVIGALRVSLGLDSAQFERSANDAERRAYQLGERIGKALRSPVDAAISLKGALAGIATGATVAAFTAAAQRAFDFTDAIVDLADRTGASTKAIQEFRYAAQLSGSSVEAADTALEKFARTQGLAQAGSDGMVKLFRQLGVTSTDFDTALRQTIDGISKLPTVQQRNATAMQLFGKSAASLTALLGQGSKGFNDLAAEAQRLGVVLGDDVLRNAGQANDTLDRMKMILNAQFANAVAQNADSIVALAGGVGRLTAELLNFMSKNPERALAIMGALGGGAAGLAVGGLSGAAVGASIGGITGYRAGMAVRQSGADGNMDLNFRRRQFANADAAYRAATQAKSAGGLLTIRRAQGDGPQDLKGATAERKRQATLLTQALKAAKAKGDGSAAAGGSLPLTGTGEAAGAARKAEADRKAAARETKRLAEEARRNEQAFQSDRFRSENELQDAQADLTASAVERFQFERNRVEREKAFNVQAIQADEHLTDAQKQKLVVLENSIATAKRELSHRQEAELISRQELERAQARSDSEIEILDAQSGLARTSKQRREIELKILAAQFAQLRLAQQAVIDSGDPNVTALDKDAARSRIGDLNKLEGLAAARTVRDTQGPLGSYLDSLPRSAAEANEAMEGVAAGGIASIIDGLSDAASGAKSLGDVFKDVASDIVRQLIRIAIQQAIVGPLTKALFPGAATLPIAGARAAGGSVVGGRNYFVGEKGIELFTPSTSGRVVANDDLGGGRGNVIHQSITFSGAVDLATRTEVYRVADAARQAAIAGVREGGRRRG